MASRTSTEVENLASFEGDECGDMDPSIKAVKRLNSGEVNILDISNSLSGQLGTRSQINKHWSKVSELSEISLDDPPYPLSSQSVGNTKTFQKVGSLVKENTKFDDKTYRDDEAKRGKDSENRTRSKKHPIEFTNQEGGDIAHQRDTDKQTHEQPSNVGKRKQTELSKKTSDEKVRTDEKRTSKVNVLAKAHTDTQSSRSQLSRGGSRPHATQLKKENGQIGKQAPQNSKTISHSAPRSKDYSHNEAVHSRKGLSESKLASTCGVINDSQCGLPQSVHSLLNSVSIESKASQTLSSKLRKFYDQDDTGLNNGSNGSQCAVQFTELTRPHNEKTQLQLVQKKESTKGGKRR